MLREVKNLRQERGPGRRRWFQSDGFELVVWLSRGGEVTGVQICYNFGGSERALTWRPRSGFVHSCRATRSKERQEATQQVSSRFVVRRWYRPD